MPLKEEVRAILDKKFGTTTKLGGKGTPRRKHKTTRDTHLDTESLERLNKKLALESSNTNSKVYLLLEDASVLQFDDVHVSASSDLSSFAFIGKGRKEDSKAILPLLSQLVVDKTKNAQQTQDSQPDESFEVVEQNAESS